jgi:hypothetical protein
MASEAAVAVINKNLDSWHTEKQRNNTGCGDTADILVTNIALHAGARGPPRLQHSIARVHTQ